MTPIENITLAFNCKEDRNKMSPCSGGLHCSSCDKTVFDFRKSTIQELNSALQKNGTICGQFTRSQIAHPIKNHKIKRFVASVLLAIGLSAYSQKLYAQIEPIAVEADSTSSEDMGILGMIYETMPVFKNGGESGMMKFLEENIKYPADSAEGRVYIRFTIDTTGHTKDFKIARGLSKAADEEVIRVVKLLEFIPGEFLGKKKEISYMLPVTFSRKKEEKK